MKGTQPSANANSDSNFVGIFGSESELDPTRRRVLLGDDTHYEDLQSSELEKDLKRSSVGGEDFDDMPDVPDKIRTPPRRFNPSGGRANMKYDDISKSGFRHRAVTVDSELDQERIDREMEKIAYGLLDNRAVSYDDLGLDSDLNPDDIHIDFRAQSDSESDELSFGHVNPTSSPKVPDPLNEISFYKACAFVLRVFPGHRENTHIANQFPTIAPLMASLFKENRWTLDMVKQYFTLPSGTEDMKTLSAFQAALDEIHGSSTENLAFEIQGKWTAVDAETATHQDIEVSGDVVTVNGPENSFKLISNRDSTLSLVVDNVKWWFRPRRGLVKNGKDEINWVSADNVRIKWKRVADKITKVRAGDEELVQKISDRRKQYVNPSTGSAPPSSISAPKRTQSSAELQITKLRSIVDSQKMEIQELRDKLKESSYNEINRLNKEIDRLKEVAKRQEEDIFHYKSAYEDLKRSLEPQTHFRSSRSIPLRGLSEDRRENFNQTDKQPRSLYGAANSVKAGARAKSESQYSVRSEPDKLGRRASKDIRLARDNVELRERLEEKNDFIHGLLNLQEKGLSKALQEEVAVLAAQLRDPVGMRSNSAPNSSSPIHKSNLSLGSFFEDDPETARVNRMENEIMKLNQKLNIIKHASEQPIVKRKQNHVHHEDSKRIPYRKRTRTRSSSSSHHKRNRSYGATSRKARSHTPQILHEKYSTTNKGAPRHRSLTAERQTPASGPVKRFRIDVYEDSENGSVESPGKVSSPDMAQKMYMSMPSEQQARINRIRKRFRKDNSRHTGHTRRPSRSGSRSGRDKNQNWYVSNVA